MRKRTETTTRLEDLTNPQLLRSIVEAEQDCPTCHGYGGMSSLELVGIPGADPMYGCETCDSTGKVPILDPKLMRLPCPYPCHCQRGPLHTAPCLTRGWVPNPDPGAMKKALHLAEFHLSEDGAFWAKREDCYWANCRPKYELSDYGETVWDADPERARLLAVAQAFMGAGIDKPV